MSVQVVTPDDLKGFKEELIERIERLLKEQSGASGDQWIKSAEVMRILHVSRGTLQHLRKIGTLPYTRVGGIIYYERADVVNSLRNGKTGGRKKNG